MAFSESHYRDSSPSTLTRNVEEATSVIRDIRTQLQHVRGVYERDLHDVREAIAIHKCEKCGESSARSDESSAVVKALAAKHTLSSADEGFAQFSMKPIGYIESLFKYKNGTPRQPVVSDKSRAKLTIDKSVFNNPEHSLEGLEQFSHLWIIFVFHKNNNQFTKAKVKPPRLDGKKVGLFSTRSPYRPNPIGLTLAKIERITGGTLHLSGIDIIDGTPVLDIKPYIPKYDHPPPISIPQTKDSTESNNNAPVLASHVHRDLSQYYSSTKRAVMKDIGKLKDSRARSTSPSTKHFSPITKKETAQTESTVSLVSNDKQEAIKHEMTEKVQEEVKDKSLNVYFYKEANVNAKTEESQTVVTKSKKSKLPRSRKECTDGKKEKNVAISNVTTMSDSVMSCNLGSNEDDSFTSKSSLSSKYSNPDVSMQISSHSETSEQSDIEECQKQQQNMNHEIVYGVRSRLPKPGAGYGSSSSHNFKSRYIRRSVEDSVLGDLTWRTRSASPSLRRSYHGEDLQSMLDYADDKTSEHGTDFQNLEKKPKMEKSSSQMAELSKYRNQETRFASWIATPPISTNLSVKFTEEAESQLQSFSTRSVDPAYLLVFFNDPEDARTAITDILREDPRSAYRRRKCRDSLYYFTIDNIHVTCWFDDENHSVEVVKIKPITSVDILREKNM